jgi:signal transduction protein with GAF and PtsI domain
VAFVSTLATHAAIALANAELFEQTVARAAQLEVLQAASARMSQAGTVEEIARTVVEETHGIIDYHNARVYVVEPPFVVPVAFEGRLGAYEQVDMALLTCRLGEGFTGWVAEHGEPILVNDANRDPRGANIAGTDDIDESMLVVPMRYDGSTIGVITLSKLGLDGFGSDDLRLLTILADRAATAVGSARLLTRTQDLAGAPLLEEDYLILSTIHSAKGCEWDAVYVLHAADGNIPSDMTTGSQDLIEEERRLFYVALTRAKDFLYVCHPAFYYQKKLTSRYSISQLTRFLPDSVLDRFQQVSLRNETPADTPLNAPGMITDIRSKIADMWK